MGESEEDVRFGSLEAVHLVRLVLDGCITDSVTFGRRDAEKADLELRRFDRPVILRFVQ